MNDTVPLDQRRAETVPSQLTVKGIRTVSVFVQGCGEP